jgi:hypothetical protein
MKETTVNTETLVTPRAAGTQSVSSWSRDSHPPSPLDRIAMRVGLALVLWSRHRQHARPTRESEWELAAHRNRMERERQAREQAWLASAHTLPRR